MDIVERSLTEDEIIEILQKPIFTEDEMAEIDHMQDCDQSEYRRRQDAFDDRRWW